MTSAKISLPSGAWPSKMWINNLSLENTSYIFLSREAEPRISQYFCVLWYFLKQSFSAVPSTVLIFTGQNTSFAQILTALLCFSLLSHCLSHQEERKTLSPVDRRSKLQPICHVSFLTAHPNTALVTTESWNPNTVHKQITSSIDSA